MIHNNSPPKNLKKSVEKIADEPIKESKEILSEPVVDPEVDPTNFIDFTAKRAEVTRMASDRRSAVRKNVTGPFRMQ